jgi:hypothetical protein
MEGEAKKSGWKIWIYLTPVYIILAIPLYKWSQRINSSDVGLSKEESNAFNSDVGVIKRHKTDGYDPGLTDSGYAVRYRSDGAAEGSLAGDGPSREAVEKVRKEAEARQAQAAKSQAQGGEYEAKLSGQAALESNDTRVKEQMGLGKKTGYLSYAVGKVMNNPKAAGALLNNKYVVDGFMSRATVKAATGSPEGLANYLKGPGPANFMNNPVVKAALNNPALVSAVATSGMVGAMLNSPAAKALMSDPAALSNLIDQNPQLVALAMQNPQTLSMLMSNPDVSGLIGKFDTSKIKKY